MDYLTIIWNCDVCGEAIELKAGYLTVSYVEIDAHRKALQQWKDEHPGHIHTADELLEIPDSVKWKALHQGCDPEPESNDYWIPLDDCRTDSDLLDWTLHLIRKNWFQTTDWPETVQKARTGRARSDF